MVKEIVYFLRQLITKTYVAWNIFNEKVQEMYGIVLSKKKEYIGGDWESHCPHDSYL